ncbi:hypothetical protein [Chromobacterium haemolyticum]|nr:hypothetical protein [Chromobacterium haemolyticum]
MTEIKAGVESLVDKEKRGKHQENEKPHHPDAACCDAATSKSL